MIRTLLILSAILLSSCEQSPDGVDALDPNYELSWYYDKEGQVVNVQCKMEFSQQGQFIVKRLTDCREI